MQWRGSKPMKQVLKLNENPIFLRNLVTDSRDGLMTRFDGVKNMLRNAIRRDAERREGSIWNTIESYNSYIFSASMNAISNIMSLGKTQN